jgi:TonB family protein
MLTNMFKLLIISLLLVLTSVKTEAQDTTVTYLSTDWDIVPKRKAFYYRKTFQIEESMWKMLDYYMNDTLQMSGTFLDSDLQIRHGFFEYYYNTGSKQEECTFVHNKRVGDQKFWYENGNQETTGSYDDNGLKGGVWRFWREDGTIRLEESRSEGKLNGESTYYYANGKRKYKKSFVNDRMIGDWILYYENGNVQEKRSYNDNGKKHGVWKAWDLDSNLLYEKPYVNGVLEGECVYYFPDGKIKGRAKYEAGKKVEGEDFITDGTDFIEVDPQFVGGDEAIIGFIVEHIRYPEKSAKKGHQGISYISFVVNKDGSLQDIEVLRSSGFKALDQEAMRVVRLMPNWIPGKQNGKLVRVRYTLPIHFQI